MQCLSLTAEKSYRSGECLLCAQLQTLAVGCYGPKCSPSYGRLIFKLSAFGIGIRLSFAHRDGGTTKEWLIIATS